MVLVLLFSLLHKQVTLWLLTPSCLSMIAVLFYVSCEFSDRKVFCTGVLWLAECVFNYREEREGRRWRGHCSHSPWAVPFTGETRTGLHSVSFVWTLCSENPFISDIYEDLVYIFVFGYYLRLCSHFGMHHPQYGRTQMKTGFHGLSQARVQAKQLFDFSFTSRWGGHQIWIFTLIWHGLNYMPSSVITLAFQYSRDMLSIQILIGNSGPKVQWWINHR